MGKLVAALDPDGKFGFIDEDNKDKLPAGARVLTKAQEEEFQAEQAQAAAEKVTDERYEALPTWRKVAGALVGGGNPDAPPKLAATSLGTLHGATGGLGPGLVRQGYDAIGGKEAGDAYAQHVEETKAAHPYAYGAGNVVGTVGAIAAGDVAEGAAAARLGLGAAKAATATTALGRAATTAARLGARGAVEGAVLGAGDYAGEQWLQDHDLATDKLFATAGTGALYGGATGAVLGGGASILKSGVGAGVSRLLSREATDLAVREGAEAGADVAAAPAQGKLAQLLANPTAGGKRIANELAFDALGATKVQMRGALEHVAADPGEAKAAVGEYVNGVLARAVGDETGAGAAIAAGKVGRADDLLGLIQADKARIGTELGEAVKGTPARVDVRDLAQHAADIHADMLRNPTQIAGADSFKNRILLEVSALDNAGKVAADGTIDAADAFYTRSQLAKQAYEVSKTSGAAGDAYKDFLRRWDRTTLDAIDRSAEASGKSGVGDAIRHLKRQYQLASAAEEAATGGAERIAGNNFFGLREGIGLAAGLASGHAVVPLAGALAFKLAKERGKAILAHTIYQAAERGSLARLVERTDAQIARASKGLIAAPEKGAAKAAEVMPPPRQVATKALARVAAFQANPDEYVDHAAQQTETMATHSPELATGLVQRQVQAMTFLSSKVPKQGDPDPLDPHPTVHMTAADESEFAMYAWYTEKPERFFAEVSRGMLTPEGAETAQALMPRAFEQLQRQTYEALTTQLARGHQLPFRQRQLLGQLLDFAATPEQRPDHRDFLQRNVSDVLPSNDRTASAAPKARRSTMSQNGSALDRLEAGGPGRRR